MTRGKYVAWKTTRLLFVLFDWIDETIATSVTERFLTPGTAEFVRGAYGRSSFSWEDEFYHALKHVLDTDVGFNCEWRIAYNATVASVHKIIKSLDTIMTLVSI